MDTHLRQAFELLLADAVNAFVERTVYRCGGPEAALERLRSDPDGEGVWRSEFVSAVFSEQLLDTPSAGCFVLDALERRTVPADPGGTVADVVGRLARAAFTDVLTARADQQLQRDLAFQG